MPKESHVPFSARYAALKGVHYAFETGEGDAMETEVTKKLFTVQDYYRMAQAGILRPEDRVELIDGEIIEMSPIGYRHAVCVSRMSTMFLRTLGERVTLQPQVPLRLSKWTEPQPDIVLCKPRADFYLSKRPVPAEDVLLTLEVSDTSLSKDQKLKPPKYAEAGICEYWVADLRNNILYVYRNPNRTAFDTILIFHPGDAVSLLAFPDINFRVDELLSTDCEIPVDEL
jgi:Uma2 family endonuclease